MPQPRPERALRKNGASETRSTPAYQQLADQLRREIRERRYADGKRLPTEAELGAQHQLSRQTVRRAFFELVNEGLIYRIPGHGTFAHNDAGKYMRPNGSIEDLMSIAADTTMEIISPPTVRVDLEAAGRLRLDTDEVVTIQFRRFHEGQPYCVTTAYIPVDLGRRLAEIPELNEARVPHQLTVLSVVQTIANARFTDADQSVTAVPATARVAKEIDLAEGDPALRIDRLYFDAGSRPVELAVNYFNPDRYSYRFHMRASQR